MLPQPAMLWQPRERLEMGLAQVEGKMHQQGPIYWYICGYAKLFGSWILQLLNCSCWKISRFLWPISICFCQSFRKTNKQASRSIWYSWNLKPVYVYRPRWEFFAILTQGSISCKVRQLPGLFISMQEGSEWKLMSQHNAAGIHDGRWCFSSPAFGTHDWFRSSVMQYNQHLQKVKMRERERDPNVLWI